MKVSIVIPCYNQAEYLLDSFFSAYQQRHQDIEIIVVNDYSDDSFVNVSQYIKGFSKIIHHAENKGLSAARNTGIREASGEWILPLDADDKICHDFIKKTLGVNDIVAGYCQEFGHSNLLWKPKTNPTNEDFQRRNQINHCALFKKDMWKKLGGYDENMRDGFEDWDFWLRATAAGYNVSVVSEALFYYRKRGDSMVTHALKNRNKITEYMRKKGSLIT